MSRGGIWLGLVLPIALGGCVGFDAERAPALLKRSSAYVLPRDYVQMDVALLERPLGETYINKDLWDSIDENVVALEQRPALDDNGFRVGQIVGMPPGGLQGLWQSKRACLTPRRWMLPTGPAADNAKRPRLLLGPVRAESRFLLKQDGQNSDVVLYDAQFQLEVEPQLTNDGKIRLRFTPYIEHGERMRTVVVPRERLDFVVQVEKPSKTYPRLAWQLTLAPNEYLVIGTRYELPDTLGYQTFTQEEGPAPMQRLLVIRATRSPDGVETDLPTLEDLARASGPPPLALQATLTAVRANGH
jgi:hypothetical protein